MPTAIKKGKPGTKATRQPYYHVTDPDSVPAILAEGLKSEEGTIFVLVRDDFAPTVARDQIFLPLYALFEIDPAGVTGEVGPDDVAEFIAPAHRIIHQATIRPEYLTFWGVFAVPTNAPLESDYLAGESRHGRSRFDHWTEWTFQRELFLKIQTGELSMEEANLSLQGSRPAARIGSGIVGPRLP